MIDWNKPIESYSGYPAAVVTTLTEGDHRYVVSFNDLALQQIRTMVVDGRGVKPGCDGPIIQNVAPALVWRNLYRAADNGKIFIGENRWPSKEEAIAAANRQRSDTYLGSFSESL